jgi:hypothetical protein
VKRCLIIFEKVTSILPNSLCVLWYAIEESMLRMALKRQLFIAFVAALLICYRMSADIVINEVQSANDATILDEDGDASDWIELYNSGSTNVNLEGWGLSDNPMKWIFPEREIFAGDHLLVYASGKDRTNVTSVTRIAAPDEIPGLVMWLNADDESYAHGYAIATFKDQSSFGNEGSQSTVSQRPTYIIACELFFGSDRS